MSVPTLEHVNATVSKEYRLQVLTPMLMHGWQAQRIGRNGKPQNVPVRAEARVPSLKGMLRYWWRAMQADQSPEQLLNEEQKLFGGVGEREGRRSPVMLQIQHPLRSNKTAFALPHRNSASVKAIEEKQDFILTMRVYHKDADKLNLSRWLSIREARIIAC